MARQSNPLSQLSPRMRLVLIGAALVVMVLSGLITSCNQKDVENAKGFPPDQPLPPEGREVFFCFWNVENLFDDRDDGRTRPGDKEHDSWQANSPEMLRLKLEKLTGALLKMNDGKGPDILAICEVESIRAAELLKEALNAKLTNPELKYQHVLMKEINGGRHIAPAIITRLPVKADRTRTHGNRLRILEGHLHTGGKELIIIAAHWSSRIRDDSDAGRASYADKIYGAANAAFISNPQADILICGDFNDNPDDDSVVKNLYAIGDRDRVVRESANGLWLLNLMADKSPAKFGTHYYSGWHIFDQIVVSPGLLDNKGWSCEVDSVAAVRTLTKPGDRIGRPWRFGGEKEKGDRGYSDHFPVTVKLRVQP